MANLQALIEHVFAEAPIMIAMLRGPEHTVEFANALFLRSFGMNKSIIGKPMTEAFPELRDLNMHLDTVLNTGVPHLDYERDVILDPDTSHSTQTYFNFVYQPIKNSRGKADAICVYAMEVTAQVTARNEYSERQKRQLSDQTEQLKHQNDELKELNQSKDEFIALASHQLRTPATGVKQYLGMLLEGYVGELEERQREFAAQAYDSNERQLATINDLLQIAQIDANKIVLDYAKVDVHKLIKAVVREQKGNVERRRQKIVINAKNDDIIAWADPLRLRMVFDNLIDNASKYSRESTKITITLQTTSDSVVVQVTDQGIGIAERDFTKLFQKFSRIHNPLSIVVGGNGLGLYLAKRIIDAHKGDIQVSSVLQQGSTFTVRLPLPESV